MQALDGTERPELECGVARIGASYREGLGARARPGEVTRPAGAQPGAIRFVSMEVPPGEVPCGRLPRRVFSLVRRVLRVSASISRTVRPGLRTLWSTRRCTGPSSRSLCRGGAIRFGGVPRIRFVESVSEAHGTSRGGGRYSREARHEDLQELPAAIGRQVGDHRESGTRVSTKDVDF